MSPPPCDVERRGGFRFRPPTRTGAMPSSVLGFSRDKQDHAA